MAEESGYEEKYIGYLEHRKHTPTLTAMIEISKALKVSPVETLTRVLDLMPKFALSQKKTASTSHRDTP